MHFSSDYKTFKIVVKAKYFRFTQCVIRSDTQCILQFECLFDKRTDYSVRHTPPTHKQPSSNNYRVIKEDDENNRRPGVRIGFSSKVVSKRHSPATDQIETNSNDNRSELLRTNV